MNAAAAIAGKGDNTMSTYPGGKQGSGVYQWIINQMPPHETYVEPFLGGGAIMRLKRPAMSNIGIDSDAGLVAAKWSGNLRALGLYNIDVLCQDGIAWLAEHSSRLTESTLVYCDPPYLISTRASKKRIYKHEMTEDDHRQLLDVLLGLRCQVAISGYWSELYNDTLRAWRVSTFSTTTRGATPAVEYLWTNYPRPVELHDYRYLGYNFRERERIGRKKKRWLARLDRMPDVERYAMLAALDEFRRGQFAGASPDPVVRDLPAVSF